MGICPGKDILPASFMEAKESAKDQEPKFSFHTDPITKLEYPHDFS